ncbi:MAG: hypothetical protein H7315_15775 [Herminiimonas sp.]|nr:hypothetical protein [Herminiimonas sp.]
MIMPAMKLTSARQPSRTPTGAGGQASIRVARGLMTGRTYFSYDIAAGPLRKAMADFFADPLIVGWVETGCVLIGDGDDFHRYF